MTSESVMKPDLDSRENIKTFIELFYEKVLKDDMLAHIFTDVAKIDVNVHIPTIRKYWEKLLLGEDEYNRHTMNIHRDVHAKFPLTRVEFDQWLKLFVETARDNFEGPKTDRAIEIASAIAYNMDVSLNKLEAYNYKMPH